MASPLCICLLGENPRILPPLRIDHYSVNTVQHKYCTLCRYIRGSCEVVQTFSRLPEFYQIPSHLACFSFPFLSSFLCLNCTIHLNSSHFYSHFFTHIHPISSSPNFLLVFSTCLTLSPSPTVFLHLSLCFTHATTPFPRSSPCLYHSTFHTAASVPPRPFYTSPLSFPCLYPRPFH
jgi:hypothetical protein